MDPPDPPPASRPSRRAVALSVLATLVAPVVIFAKGLVGLQAFAPRDGSRLFIPWFLVSARAWRAGHLPTWNPWAAAGMPQLGSSQSGALYLPNLLFLVLSPVVADNITILLSFLIAGLGAWLLARLLCQDLVAATVGGLAFGLCAFLFAHIAHQSMIAGAAWLPWMLFCFELLQRRFTPGRLLGLGGVIALSLLAGHTQIFFMDLLLLGAYAAGIWLLGKPRQPRALLAAVSGALVGLGLGAVQLIPTILVAAASARTSYSYRNAMTFSLPISHLPLLVFPYLFGSNTTAGPWAHGYTGMWNLEEISGYVGAAALVLALVGLSALRDRRSARAMAGMGVLALLIAIGPATPLSWVLYVVPIYGQFRSWGRYLVGVDLCVAMLAAYGVAALRKQALPASRRAIRRAAITVAVLAVAALGLPHLGFIGQFIPNGASPAPAALAVPLAAALAGLGCVVLLLRAPRLGAIAVIAVIALDGYLSFGGSFEWRNNSPSVAQLNTALSASTPLSWGAVSPAPGGLARYLYLGVDIRPVEREFIHITDVKAMSSLNASNVLGARQFSAATGVVDVGEDGITADLWRPTSRVLDLLRVTTVLVDPRSSGGGPGPDSLLTNGTAIDGGTMLRYQYTPKLPEAFLVGSVSRQSTGQDLRAIHGLEPFDPAALAYLDAACPRCPTGAPGSAGSASAVTWGINSARLNATASRPALLVLSQAWDAGWRARVDGRPAPVVRVDGLVQGVPLAAGDHSVVLTYHAPGLRLGLLVTVLTFLVLLGLLWRSRSAPGGRQAGPGADLLVAQQAPQGSAVGGQP